MVVASGFVEVNELNDVEKVVNSLKMKEVEVNDVNGEKVVFLVERKTTEEVKKELESLRNIDGVKNVYLAYFSIEGGDENTSEFTDD